jgi:hypothetical protein
MVVYVVTNSEIGWDCVVGVYTDKEYVENTYKNKDLYVIHTKMVNNETLQQTNANEELKKYGRTSTEYPEMKYNYETDYLIMDSFNYILDRKEVGNSVEIVSLILDNFKLFCDEIGVTYGNLYMTPPYDGKGKYAGNRSCFADKISIDDDNLMCDFENYLNAKGIKSLG